MPRDKVTERAIQDVADKRPVDWDFLENSAKDQNQRERLRWLRLVDRMADVHRTPNEPPTATTSRTLENGLPSSAQRGIQMWGRYQLLETCGEGSFGRVYRAWDPELEREIAIKILHEDQVDLSRNERLLREGRALAQIQHPNVVRVLGVEAFEGRIGLCMEFVRGETLEALLAVHGKWNARETLIVGKDICAALAAVHRSGLLHRDVKARNVMRDPTGRVVLMDFGTGRAANPSLMLTLNLGGTPLYMAAEVLAGEPASVSSDVYSVGVLLYHLLTAAYPFEGQTTEELREAHRLGPQRRLIVRRPDLPVAIVRVVERALAVSVDERYATADALFNALDAAGGEPRAGHEFDAEQPHAKSLVVMPTQVFGESPDEFLADAVPNAISKYLARVPGLEVERPPSRGDLERLGGGLEHIAALYGAAAYVISTVASPTAERLTLSVQLVDTRSRRILWSNDYEGTTESPANVTMEAAEGIRRAVQPNAEPVRAVPSKKSDIELLVQRGSYHLNMFTNLGRPSDVERAASAFEQAAALDPGNVDAAVGMALLHDARIPKGGPPAEVIPESEKWARRAIGIDPHCSTAWAVLCDLEGMLCEFEPIRNPRRVAMALEYGLKAAGFGPHDAVAHTHLAGCLMMHSYELSLAAAREAARLNPLVLAGQQYAAICLMQLDRGAEALAAIREALAVEPDDLFGVLIEAMLLADSGHTSDAEARIVRLEAKADRRRDSLPDRDDRRNGRARMKAGRLLPPHQWPRLFRDVAAYREAVRQGDFGKLEQLATRLGRMARGEELFPRWYRATQGVSRLVAEVKPELSLDLLEARALLGIMDPYDYLATHSEYNPLRGHPRFQQLLATARRSFEETTIPAVRAAHGRQEAPGYLVAALDGLISRLQLD